MKNNLDEKLAKKPYLFKKITTLSVTEFDLLKNKLAPEWKRGETKRLSQKKRSNKIGQGRPYSIGNFGSLLLATVIYLRTNIGYELLSLIFAVDQSTVKRTVRRVAPLLADRFIPKTALTKGKRRINDLDELLKEYPELKEIIFDGSELPIRRPKRRQSDSYSGKKKRHTKKIQVAVDCRNGLVVGVSRTEKGKIHDKKHLEKTGWDSKLPVHIKRRGDSGYQGMPEANWVLPKKKPRTSSLTLSEKRSNKKKARRRIIVEHALRGMKVFRRIGELITIKSDDFLNEVIRASANLFNFKRLVRQGI